MIRNPASRRSIHRPSPRRLPRLQTSRGSDLHWLTTWEAEANVLSIPQPGQSPKGVRTVPFRVQRREYIAQRTWKFGGRQAWEPDLRRKVVFRGRRRAGGHRDRGRRANARNPFSNVTHFLEWCRQNVPHFPRMVRRRRLQAGAVPLPRDSEWCPIAAYIRHCLLAMPPSMCRGRGRLVQDMTRRWSRCPGR